jgi:hypothetical protein
MVNLNAKRVCIGLYYHFKNCSSNQMMVTRHPCEPLVPIWRIYMTSSSRLIYLQLCGLVRERCSVPILVGSPVIRIKIFHGFPRSIQANLRSQLLPSETFIILYLSIISTFDTVHSGYWQRYKMHHRKLHGVISRNT